MTNTATAPAWAAFYFEPFPGMDDAAIVDRMCSRCGGSGAPLGKSDRLPLGGLCFECDGAKVVARETVATARAREKARAQRVARAEAKRLARVAARDALVEAATIAHPAEVAWLQANEERSSFARSLWERLALFVDAKGPRDLSDAQWAAVARAIDTEAAREAAKAEAADLVEGRREIEGVVVSQKSVETAYGTAWKMVLDLGDGTRVYGSQPSSIMGEIEKGVRVALTATIERSHDDRLFGFYSRPTKARVL